MAARLGGREALRPSSGPGLHAACSAHLLLRAIRTVRQAVMLLPTHHAPCPPHLGCEGSTGAPRPGDDQSPPSRAALTAAAAGKGAAAAAASSAAEAGSRASAARREGAGATSSEWAAVAAGGGWRRRPAPAAGESDRSMVHSRASLSSAAVVHGIWGAQRQGACLQGRQMAPRRGDRTPGMPA